MAFAANLGASLARPVQLKQAPTLKTRQSSSQRLRLVPQPWTATQRAQVAASLDWQRGRGAGTYTKSVVASISATAAFTDTLNLILAAGLVGWAVRTESEQTEFEEAESGG